MPPSTVHLSLAAVPTVRVGRAGTAGAVRALAPQDAALLAWLAIEGATSRARIAALLWPEKDAEEGRNLLRQRLFKLRRVLGFELVTGANSLALADGVTHDLRESDSVLGDLPADGVAPGDFAHWLGLQRERRRSRVRGSLTELATLAEQARAFDDALSHAQQLLALEPLSEAAHRRVIRLHYLRGDRAAALLAFDACERMLTDEVGARPAPETLELLAVIEGAASAAVPALRVPEFPAALLRPPRLVGRDRAWRSLASAWSDLRVAWLVGEGGLGKSRLLGDFVAAQAPARLLVVGGRPGDAVLPNALLCRMLRAVLARHPVDLPAGTRAELACLLPELGPGAGTVDATRLAMAVETVLASAAREGLQGLAIDDLHWADRASVEALLPAFGVAGLRWLVAQRPAEGDAEIQSLREQLVSAQRAEVIRLEPLAVAEVAELLGTLGVPGLAGEDMAAALHRRCGGNFMLLIECVKSEWAEHTGGGTRQERARTESTGAPDTSRPRSAVRLAGGLIERRFERLSPEALRLARCAAVAGQDFNAGLAAHVLKRDALDLADAWAELEGALVLSGGNFAHDLVYEAALASVPAPIAAELHAAIAEFLEARDAESARVAAHWLAAQQPQRALPHLRRAARVAMRQWRNAEAVAWLDEASRIAEAAGHWEDALRDHVMAVEIRTRSRPADAADAKRARALTRDERSRAWALIVETAYALESGDVAAAAEHAAAARALAHRWGLVEAEAESLFNSGVIAWDRGQTAEAVEHMERALAMWRALDPETCLFDARDRLQKATSALGLFALRMGRFDEAHRRLQNGFDVALGDHAAAQGSIAARELLSNAVVLGRSDEARHWEGVVDRTAQEYPGRLFEQVLAARARAEWAVVEGRWVDALGHFDAMESAIRDTRHRYAPRLLAARALFDFDLGRLDLALRRLRALQAATPPTAIDRLVIDLALVCAGQRADVLALLDQLATHPDLALRSRLLPRLAPHCDPDMVLPTLALAAQTARDGGGLGVWAPVQAARAAALARGSRHDEAAACAHAAWAETKKGVVPACPGPRFAADIAAALAPTDATTAAAVARAGLVALRQACQGLPDAWREPCLNRSEMALQLGSVLRSIGRAASSGPDVERIRLGRKTRV